MINEPRHVVADNFQYGWLDVVKQLKMAQWELNNIIVHVRNIEAIDEGFHDKIEAFAEAQSILAPKHVAYTIFPHGLYRGKNAADLFKAYNKQGGFFDRVKTRWGTYFRRMTNYRKNDITVNQLGKIISAIRHREKLSKAAYTVIIQYPGGETVQPLGGPCLNYLAVQAEPAKGSNPITIGLLAVYRNL